MTKIDIFSGFLGAGKTTLIKKLLQEAYVGEKVVLIENEFGEIGIDGGFLQDAGVQITEMNSGCICCSLVGDFSKALEQVAKDYAPDRILIEPSGVGKLSDVVKAVESASLENTKLGALCVVVDASKCKMYMKNFGEFFNDQVENASCLVLSHTGKTTEEKLKTAIALLREKNPSASLVAADWTQISGKDILETLEQKSSLQKELAALSAEVKAHHHEHHHDHEECDDEHCCCHDHAHHHEHHEHCHGHHEDGHERVHGCHEHEHHHHHEECDDEHCCCHGHEHEHHHDHEECDDEHCCCHDHAHHGHHHGHHHADEVFTSWGRETANKYTKVELESALRALEDEEKYGKVLRAKGIVAGDESWLYFDYVPEEADVREGGAQVIGRLCVIGCKLNEKELERLFKL